MARYLWLALSMIVGLFAASEARATFLTSYNDQASFLAAASRLPIGTVGFTATETLTTTDGFGAVLGTTTTTVSE
jgi:hypothetical protein